MKSKKLYIPAKNSADRIVKTAYNKRNTYIYRYFCRESESNKSREYIEEIELIPGEDGITIDEVKKLYALEDSEVYYNLKARRPQRNEDETARIAEWKADYIRGFKAKHGYEPHPADVIAAADEMFPKNWSASLDEILDGKEDDYSACGDKYAILARAYSSFDSEPGAVDMMDEIAATWPESWQEIYEHVLKNHETIVSIARERSVTEGAVRKTYRKILKTLSENPELRKFIRFFD